MREFRAHHDEFLQYGVTVACFSHESVDSNRHWQQKLGLPYALLSDERGEAAEALAVVRHVKLGPWTVDLHRRITFLIDARGDVGAVWERVKVRGHAAEVLALAKVAGRPD